MTESRWKLRQALAAILLVGITTLPAGVGNVGRKTDTGGGSGGNDGLAELSFNPTVTEAIQVGEALTDVRDDLINQINNNHPAYSATVGTDPGDAGANSILVLKNNGQELTRLTVKASDDNIKDIGVHFPNGKPVMFLGHPGSLNADGTYRLVIDRVSGADFDVTYDTSIFPNDTPLGLMGHIVEDLQAAGYTAQSSGKKVTIVSPGNQMLAGRVYATDTGAAVTEIGLGPVGQGVPTLSHLFMFLLVAALTSAAIFMLRRRTPAT